MFSVSILSHIFTRDISVVLTGLNKNNFDEIINDVFTNKMISCVNMSGTNSRTRIFGNKNCPHIITPHNDLELHFNEHTPQQIKDKTDFLYRLRQCITLLSLGSPPDWNSKQRHDESSDTDPGFRISCLITIAIQYQFPFVTFMSWLYLYAVHFGIQHKFNNYLHLLVGATSMHFESSLTTFAKSGLEYLIRCRSIPTPDLYFNCIAASTLSASSGLTIFNHGVPGVP
jgi:hypothetical protein